MKLAGQEEREGSERGYAMAALLVAIAVMAVLMTVAMPVWKHAAQREKEEELVFRGEQYARAIGLFQRKFAGAAPPSIDFLVEQRFLRKKYKDPITNDDFVPLVQGQSNLPGAMPNGGRGAATPGAQPPPTPSAALTPLGAGRGQAGPGNGPGSAQPGSIAGGIMGVTSKSKEKSIRLYKGRNHYNEWQFVFTQQTTAPGAGGGEAGAPGQRGRGQRGGAFGPGQRGQGPRGRGERQDGRGFGGRGQPLQPQPRPGR